MSWFVQYVLYIDNVYHNPLLGLDRNLKRMAMSWDFFCYALPLRSWSHSQRICSAPKSLELEICDDFGTPQKDQRLKLK